MQIDMHYYACFALAHLAGFPPEAAAIIANCSQYVDDSVKAEVKTAPDGSKLLVEETAHITADVKNVDPDDQRMTWLPFHFLPACEGDTFMAKLTCQALSKPFLDLLLRYELIFPEIKFKLPFLGVVAHCLADTFSHQGFSGVSSPLNKVVASTIAVHNTDPVIRDLLGDKLAAFLTKHGDQGGLARILASETIEAITGAVGHGAVATYPDEPYLKWEYRQEESGKTIKRNNQEIFLAGCQALLEFFQRFKKQCLPTASPLSNPTSYQQCERAIQDILAIEHGHEERSQAWSDAVACGDLGPALAGGIPPYLGHRMDEERDCFTRSPNPSAIANRPLYGFYAAASLHRHYVLRELLPSWEIVVI